MSREHARNATLYSPRFLSFLAAQFLGAANDNAFKATLGLYILATVPDATTQLRYNNLATALFPLPFLLFSPLAGYLADRFSKYRVLAFTKAPEVLAMALAIGAFASGSLPFLFAVLFLMATQSTFFSPAKYGLLPEAIRRRDLSMANGVLQMTTSLAILVGSAGGVFVYSTFKHDLSRTGWIFLGAAVAGMACAAFVPRTPPGNRDAELTWNLWSATRQSWREAQKNPVLLQTLLGITYFWFLGAIFLTVVPVYGKNILGLSEEAAGVMLVLLSLGIGLGSILAGKLSRGQIELGLVPLGSIGLCLFSLDLALFGNGSWRAWGFPVRDAVDTLLLGISAGMFIVPLNALLQQRSPDGMKGRLIAFSNVLTFTGVMVAAFLLAVANDVVGLDSRQVLLATAVIGVGATLYIIGLLPTFLVRLVLWVLTNTIYRIRVEGRRHLPDGGALFVANHVAYVDPLLIGAASDRMLRFLMYRPFYEAWPLHGFFKKMGTIPVASGDPPELVKQSLDRAREQIDAGHIICIFAEGALTRTGNLLKFKRGFERIAEGMTAPIVPLYLDGVWGSIFSYERGKLLASWPRQLPYPVRVVFGKPMPAQSTAVEVRERIQELSVQAFRMRKENQRRLEVDFLRTAQRFWRRPFLLDSAGRSMTFGEALGRALRLAERLGEANGSRGERVGIALPLGIPSALAHLAVLMAGKVVVDLDASSPDLRQQIEQAGIRRVMTLGAAGETRCLGADTIVTDDGSAPLSLWQRTRAWTVCNLLPTRWAAKMLFSADPKEIDDTAAIVFSSSPHVGGQARGAMLSHHNIQSNLESLKQVLRVSRSDRVLGVVPPTSGFGLFGTILLPATVGVPVVYHENADDSDTVARLCAEHHVTILPVATSSLERYAEAIDADSLADVRMAIVAGDPLTLDLRDRFQHKFGVEPLEGFGCAECAPLISLNVPTWVRGRHGQPAQRAGTSGKPLPGMAVKIVDPATGSSLPPETDGDLWVQGANVMQGYVNDPESTRRVLANDWYRTGYRASQDRDGFLTILGPVEQPA